MQAVSPLNPLLERLARESRLDVDAEVARFMAETGEADSDGFLSWLHDRRRISDGLFADLCGAGTIEVARYVGVKERTLVLEPPRRTLLLAADQRTVVAGTAQAATVVAGTAQAATVVAALQAATLVAGGTGAPVNGNAHAGPIARDPGRSRYSLLGCLGKGAMGEVHVARDEDLLRKVAFKKMVPEVAHSRALAARFFSEIQVTAQLDHPNIVPIYGLEVTADGSLGYSMKLVKGRTLADVFEEARAAGGGGVRELAARLETFLKVCDAMAYAHSKGVLHRDLKPENVMVGRYNEVYVMDWGICRVIGSDDPDADQLELGDPTHGRAPAPTDRTQYGAVLGTPAYMSPEQASGKNPELDARSDVYALGLILFEAISLRQAVTGETLETVLARAVAGDKNPFVPFAPGRRLPRELGAIVARATVPAPAERYASAGALAEDLRRYLRGEAPLASPDSALQRLARYLGQHRAGALATMMLLVAVAAAGTIGVLAHEKQALARAKLHEERVQAFVTAVATQAHAVDNQVHDAEGLLLGLAGRAAQLVESRPAAGAATVYLNEDYQLAGHGPPDLAASRYYGLPVSLGHPTVKLAPGLSRADVEAELRLAEPLRAPMASVLLGAAGGVDDPAVAKRLLDDGAALLRVFVTLESGVHMSYPGLGGFPSEYDGRKRPKYRLAAGKKGVFWGNPYPDQFGHGLLLPMATSLYDSKGRLLGVCGADTTFHFIAENLLALPGYADLDDAYLVDDQGRVVVHSATHAGARVEYGGEGSSRFGDLHGDQPIELAPLPYPEVVAELTAGRSGLVRTSGGRLAAFTRLSALGWYYVVLEDEARLTSR